tara:strand:- start:26903 stop:27883 length:981 start_codon:yes stop_codon:yes gene_type:complete
VIGVVYKMKLNVGAIGYKNHAKKILEIFKKRKNVFISKIYYPKKINGIKFTRNLNDLINCDVILILSPNYTHYKYLKFFEKRFKGYIFCEKPPAVSLKELNKLKNDPEKTFFNFNLRYGKIFNILNDLIKRKKLGNIYHAYISSSHLFGKNINYKKSWRSKQTLNKLGLVENVGIHYIDLFSILFNKPKEIIHYSSNIVKETSSYDNCSVIAKYPNNLKLFIYLSYVTAFDFHIKLIGTNGIFEIYDNKAQLLIGHKKNIHTKRYCRSSVSKTWKISEEDIMNNSLEKSIDYFLNICLKNKKFPLHDFKNSIEINKQILKSKKIIN